MRSKKYLLTYEDYEENGVTSKDLAEQVLTDPDLPQLDEIIIGCFGAGYDNESDCQDLLEKFIENKEKLNHIKSFFIGDMDYEECEVSWISQGNYDMFLKAFPNLKKLTVKGSNDLTFGNLFHDQLEHLEIICGGLPKSVINEIVDSHLPKLSALILYVGIDNYGFDGEIEDFKSICKKDLFPNLKHLGIVDSEEQDEVTRIVLESDILPQLETLQLSYGTFSDKGGQMLLDNEDKISHLKAINLSYHFMSDNMMKKLKNLPMELDMSEQNDNDEKYGNYPMLTE